MAAWQRERQAGRSRYLYGLRGERSSQSSVALGLLLLLVVGMQQVVQADGDALGSLRYRSALDAGRGEVPQSEDAARKRESERPPLADVGGAEAAGRTSTAPEGGVSRQHGPFRLRHLDTISLAFHQAVLEPAGTLRAGQFRLESFLEYGSSQTASQGRDWRAQHDLETLRWTWSASLGLTDDLELGIHLPFTYASSGFLDEFIDDFHSSTGLEESRRPRDAFTDFAARDGTVFAGTTEDELELADLSLSLKYAFLEDSRDGIGLATRGAIDLPTGDSDRGFGSGGVEASLGLLAEKHVGPCSLYMTVDALFQGTPTMYRRAGVRLEPVVLSGGVAVELRLVDWLVPVVQVHYAQSLFRDGRGERFEHDRIQGSLGFWIPIVDDVDLQLGLVEDLLSAATPDVSFFLGLVYRN